MNRIIILLFAMLLSFSLFSQDYQRHEFSVDAMGGVSSLDYDLSEGSSKNKISGGIGFGYTYFFKKNLGFVTGVDFAFYNTEVELNNFSSNHNAFDLDIQKDFEFRYTLNNYKETQSAFYLNIPIMLHYQFTDGEKVKFYASGGAKLGLPISGKYKNSSADLKTSGYYSHDNSTWDNPKFRGFGDFVTKQYNSEIKYKMALSLALEVGAKWTLPKEMAIYTGVYMDYGLNDINQAKKTNVSLVEYNQINPEDHIFNGVVASSHKTESGSLKSIVNKINATAYGIKVRFAFGK